jgi:lipopolysaccharide biosynthesis glycosyltransferase
MKAAIYTAYHKFSGVLKSPSLVPIHVGRAKVGKPLAGMIGDDTGDNISKDNLKYCELTALYWAWKNDRDSTHIGLMHYRRLLDFGDHHPYDMAENPLGELRLNDYAARTEAWLAANPDVALVVPKLHRMKRTVAENYRTGHKAQDLAEVEKIIRRDHPQYVPHFEAVMRSKGVRLANMMLARRDISDEYCAFLFDVLGQLDAAPLDRSRYSSYQLRFLGFISERLFTVFVHKFMAEHPAEKISEVNILNLTNALVFPYCSDDSFNTLEDVNIALSSDDAYLPHAAAMIASVLQHASPARRYNFFYLYTDVSATRLEVFGSIFRRYGNATLHPINVGNPFKNSYRSRSRAPSNATYNRFLLFELLPTLRRLLYIDGDMIVTGDVAEIFDIPMRDKLIAAVPDFIMTRTLNTKVGTVDKNVPDLYKYQRDVLGLNDQQIHSYFNAGLLVFNFAKMDVAATGAELLRRVGQSRFMFRDQDLLNSYFKDSYLRLPAKYNVFNSNLAAYLNVPGDNHAEAMEAKRAPFVVHYAAKDYKPWDCVEVEYADLYWDALRKTPFYLGVLSLALTGVGAVTDAGLKYPIYSKRGLTARARKLADRYPSIRPALRGIYYAVFNRGK